MIVSEMGHHFSQDGASHLGESICALDAIEG
jgi:hypothetical protein